LIMCGIELAQVFVFSAEKAVLDFLNTKCMQTQTEIPKRRYEQMEPPECSTYQQDHREEIMDMLMATMILEMICWCLGFPALYLAYKLQSMLRNSHGQ